MLKRNWEHGNLLKMVQIKCVFLDLSGTLHVDNDPTPNAVEALERLRKLNVNVRFVTNTSKDSSNTLHSRLTKIGFKLEQHEMFSSIKAAAQYVKLNQLKPYYLVSEDAMQDFPPIAEAHEQNAVVVGLAPNALNYENMNRAFRLLLNKHPLIAIHSGKYYRRGDGLALGPGPFIKGLEYAASTNSILVGKPSRKFFESALPVGVTFNECVMIGDDANDDIKGAMDNGMKGILVKTGKYLADIKIDPPPTKTLDNFAAAVEWLHEINLEI